MQIDTDIFIHKEDFWRKVRRILVVRHADGMMTENNLICCSKICQLHIDRLQIEWLKAEMANKQGAT